MRTSTHFTKRVKDRVGLSKKSSLYFLSQAIEYGLRMEDFTGRKRMMDYLESIHVTGSDIIIYNRYIIIKSSDESVGITVLNLPHEYYSTVDSIRKKKKERG